MFEGPEIIYVLYILGISPSLFTTQMASPFLSYFGLPALPAIC
jgi:hypothetical protein